MDVKSSAERFDDAVATLPEAIKVPLLGIPNSAKASAGEVRLRVGRAVSITCGSRTWFVDNRSQLHNIPRNCFRVSGVQIEEAVAAMCEYSVHSHQQELLGGYIALRGGHRAGICGTAVLTKGEMTAVRDISSLNIRIAREIRDAAAPLMEKLFKNGLCGVLIVGPPSSGKTTILRDLARRLADGEEGRYWKVSVVDERGELGAVWEGEPQNNLGVSCDVLNGYAKGEGILSAVRSLSPDVVICDEIGAKAEVDGILDGINCGVRFIASAHAASIGELLSRRQILRLIQNCAFDKIVRLGGPDNPGRIEEIIEVGELPHEASRAVPGRSMFYNDGDFHGVKLIRAGHEA